MLIMACVGYIILDYSNCRINMFRAGGGLVVSHSISTPVTGCSIPEPDGRLIRELCVPGPTQPGIGVAGVRKWGAYPVLSLVHWEPGASVPMAGEK